MTRIAIIEPRSAGCGLVLRARELGYQAVVFTADCGDRRVSVTHLAQAAQVEIVDTNDDEATLERIRGVHRQQPFDAVVPGFEHYVPLAAAAAADLGVPGLAPESVLALRYKHLMRAEVQARGIDQPRHVLVDDEARLAAAIETVGLPCVVKPVDQSGSLNVRLAATSAEAVGAFRRIHSGGTEYLDRTGLPMVLVEEYVRGDEFSVEGYVDGDDVVVVGITEKLLGPEPWFVEVGHMVPARLASGVACEIREYTVGVVRALGLRRGPFHAELRLSERGPMLMEVAARLPGDRIPDLLRLATGADLYEITLRLFLGLSPVTTAPPVDTGGQAGIRYFVRPELASYTRMTVAPTLRKDPRICEIGALIPAGQLVPDPGSSACRLGYALAVAPDYHAAAEALDLAEMGVQFESA